MGGHKCKVLHNYSHSQQRCSVGVRVLLIKEVRLLVAPTATYVSVVLSTLVV